MTMKLQYIKLAVLTAILFGMISCDPQKSKVDSGDENLIEDDETQYKEREIAEGETWDELEINNFMQEAAMIDIMQIKIADLVKDKTTNEAVAGYAQNLMTDHKQSLARLKEIAAKENLKIVEGLDPDHEKKVQKLAMTDTEFDENFLNMMVEAHKKDIDKYQNAMQSIAYTHPIKDWIDTNLPILQQHQFRAQRLLDDESIVADTKE